jgi:hypothetical protein
MLKVVHILLSYCIQLPADNKDYTSLFLCAVLARVVRELALVEKWASRLKNVFKVQLKM